MRVKYLAELYVSILDEMEKIEDNYRQLELYREKYMDFEYNFRKEWYSEMYTQHYERTKQIGKELGLFEVVLIRVRRWVQKRLRILRRGEK